MRVPSKAQKAMMEKTVGSSYGTWWRAPYPFRDFAYYMCMRRCYGYEASVALEKTKTFPGGAANLMANIREAIRS